MDITSMLWQLPSCQSLFGLMALKGRHCRQWLESCTGYVGLPGMSPCFHDLVGFLHDSSFQLWHEAIPCGRGHL